MACTPGSLLDLAKCFNCLEPKQLEAIKSYLLCQINTTGGGGGALQPYTVSFPTATLPFTYSATRRSTIEITYTLTSGVSTATINFVRSLGGGTPISIFANGTIQAIVSFTLGPGETINGADVSAGGASASIDNVVVYSQ